MESLEFRRLSLRDILHVIFKRKNQIVLFFVVVVCTVVIGTFIAEPTYEARAQVLVKVGRENLYVPPSGGKDPIISFNRDEQINSEIELLKSRALVEQVVGSLGSENIYKEADHAGAVLKLQKKLLIGRIEKSNVITISFKHKDPQMAAQIVDTLTNAFLEQHLLVHKNPQSYNFFEEQSQILKNKLKQSEETLKVFKKQHSVTALGEEQRLLLKQIADLRSELNQTINQEAETKSRINQIRWQLDRTPETIPQGEEVDHNPTVLISNLEAKLVELQIKQKELLTKYTPQSRLVQNVEEEINMVREKLAEQETKRYGKSSTGLNTTHQRLKEELFRNQAEREALAAKKETQKAQLTNFQEKLEHFSQIEVELNRLQQAIDVDRQNYRLYLSKFEEARISEAMDNKKITNVSVIEPAHKPLEPVSPKVSLNIVIGLFLGGFGGLGLAFFVEYLDDSLEKPEDVERALRLPVLASIPEGAARLKVNG
jgi:polysaccharide chain length determinant protein (PEP-CTERM system associated)